MKFCDFQGNFLKFGELMMTRAFSRTYQGKENWMIFFYSVLRFKSSVTVSDLAWQPQYWKCGRIFTRLRLSNNLSLTLFPKVWEWYLQEWNPGPRASSAVVSSSLCHGMGKQINWTENILWLKGYDVKQRYYLLISEYLANSLSSAVGAWPVGPEVKYIFLEAYSDVFLGRWNLLLQCTDLFRRRVCKRMAV